MRRHGRRLQSHRLSIAAHCWAEAGARTGIATGGSPHDDAAAHRRALPWAIELAELTRLQREGERGDGSCVGPDEWPTRRP